MPNYKLLTPGPLTTTDTVKKEMMFDHCTWDEDYKKITQEIRSGLLKLAHVSEDTYTCVLMQGSGTFGVESVLTSSVGEDDRLLIASNGAYGENVWRILQNMPVFLIFFTARPMTRFRPRIKFRSCSMSIRRLPMFPWYTARQHRES